LPPLWYKWFNLDGYEAKGVVISSKGSYAVTICENTNLQQIMISVNMTDGSIGLLKHSISYTTNNYDILTSTMLILELSYTTKIFASLPYYNSANIQGF
jgi:hypothetical protein